MISFLIEIGGCCCVIDCGLGVIWGLVEVGVVLKDFDLIFIIYMYFDYVLEFGLLLYMVWMIGLVYLVKVFGLVDLMEYWDGFLILM